MIKPTVGRVVLIHDRYESGDRSQPEVALITFVHGDTVINIVGWDKRGERFAIEHCDLVQEETPAPFSNMQRAEWMPYQKGQAAKAEALEKQLAAGPR